jgi:hypothetical protein
MARPSLADWLRQGVVRPARHGSRGQGNSHLFTNQQLLGIAYCAGLCRTSRGCKMPFAKEAIAEFEKLSDESVDAIIGCHRADSVEYTVDEETLSAHFTRHGPVKFPREDDIPPVGADPDFDIQRKYFYAAVDAIRRKKGLGRPGREPKPTYDRLTPRQRAEERKKERRKK